MMDGLSASRISQARVRGVSSARSRFLTNRSFFLSDQFCDFEPEQSVWGLLGLDGFVGLLSIARCQTLGPVRSDLFARCSCNGRPFPSNTKKRELWLRFGATMLLAGGVDAACWFVTPHGFMGVLFFFGLSLLFSFMM